jgi:hypothetical protein
MSTRPLATRLERRLLLAALALLGLAVYWQFRSAPPVSAAGNSVLAAPSAAAVPP